MHNPQLNHVAGILVPKFHLPAYVEECNLQFSFNLTKGVGRTDSEAPERGWGVQRKWGRERGAIHWTTTSAIGTGRRPLDWVGRLSVFDRLVVADPRFDKVLH